MVPTSEKARAMSNVLESDGRHASSEWAMGVWQTVKAQSGIGWRWQVVIFLASLIAVFTRLPGALLHPQFFAEDGWVWYQQAYNLHWLRSLSIAQAGYLQTLPRLVAGVTLLFPMQWAPLLMNLAGAVIQVLPVTALLSHRSTPWGPLPVRMLMAALYLAIPNAPEIHIVLTNAMWHLAVLQALIAFSVPPLGWRGRVSDVVLFAIGSMSGPFCILLLPFVFAYWWIRRYRWTLVVLGILFVGVVLQVLTLMHAVRAPGAPLGVTLVRLLRILAGNIFVNSMIGSGGAYMRIPLLVVAALGGLAIMVWGWRSAPLAVRLYIAFAACALIASLRDPLLLGNTIPRWEVLGNVASIRYWFLPSLMFLWSAAWCTWGGRSRLVRCAGLGVLLLTSIGVVRKWSYPPWPPSHFNADVERFQTLKPGEHMIFYVYDPGGRTMELVKR
jgi:hypothetical protein